MKKLRECIDCNECEVVSPFLSNLSNNEMSILNKDRFVVGYRPGELIYKQGASVTHVLSLTEGQAKVYLEGRRQVLLRIAKPVELMLGPDLFTEARHYNSLVALTEVEACYIDINNFKEVFRNNGTFAEDVIRECNQRGMQAIKRLMSMNQKQAPGLVAEALIYLAEQVFNANSFEMHLSRQDLADFCGITKESAIRVLKDFKDEGWIRTDNRLFEIIDHNRLKKISEIG